MFTAKECYMQTAINIKKRHDTIKLEINSNPELLDTLIWIKARISESIKDNKFSCELFYSDLVQAVPASAKNRQWQNILRELGFSLSFSFSSNPTNERCFISWEKPK